MDNQVEPPVLRLRVVFGEGQMMGPGKAELLERIGHCGSIAAAGREMGMSYKRAWMLIETMNAMFSAPVVESTRGGPGGGGAVLTGTGSEVLRLYRALERSTAEAGAAEVKELAAHLRDMSE
ncbi:LysR family transcriptional regulator [uncultured Roseovarius sp.]|uniref:winged helix-turn-helix domain-containing protein n=1 Tax=uncultured Roseovarius sp. TaxID=293344 RepID=UPI002634D482|nr:LysR family transcriptional regulator [uncultured Roseovarius sp.]